MALFGNPVFVYGSLMDEVVMRVLIGRMPDMEAAVLKGFIKYKVTARAYPGVVPQANTSASGKLVFDLTVEEVALLDAFEFHDVYLYAREVHSVHISKSHFPIEAHVYVYKDTEDKLDVDKPEWDLEKNLLPGKADFLEVCKKFAKDYQSRL